MSSSIFSVILFFPSRLLYYPFELSPMIVRFEWMKIKYVAKSFFFFWRLIYCMPPSSFSLGMASYIWLLSGALRINVKGSLFHGIFTDLTSLHLPNTFIPYLHMSRQMKMTVGLAVSGKKLEGPSPINVSNFLKSSLDSYICFYTPVINRYLATCYNWID